MTLGGLVPVLVLKSGYRCRYQVKKAPSVHNNALVTKSRSSPAHFFRLFARLSKLAQAVAMPTKVK